MRGLRVAICLLCLSSQGCLAVYSTGSVLRPEEKRLVYKFESEQAWLVFNKALRAKANDEGPHITFFIPLLFLSLHQEKYSENAFFNDNAMLCDKDSNRIITGQEAAAFSLIPREE